MVKTTDCISFLDALSIYAPWKQSNLTVKVYVSNKKIVTCCLGSLHTKPEKSI